MDKELIKWMTKNVGVILPSPRNSGKLRPYPFKIKVDLVKKEIPFEFVGGKVKGLPLKFWMFDKVLAHLARRRGQYTIMGAKPQPPYITGSVEEAIWVDLLPTKSTIKVSSHVCDILALAGYLVYGKAINPKTKRKVQAVQLLKNRIIPTLPSPTNNPPPSPSAQPTPPSKPISKKEEFIEEFKTIIIKWTKENEDKIVEGRHSYIWAGNSTQDNIKKRNTISKAITLSRIQNGGALDINTLNLITRWGFNRDFPLQDEAKVESITKHSFQYLDKGDIIAATNILLNIYGVGISRASKIIGLSDQEDLCIYDSRVGNALKDLKIGNKRLIKIPPGYGREADTASKYEWATQFEHLIWTVEIIKDYMNENGCTFRAADVEIGLFMMGK